MPRSILLTIGIATILLGCATPSDPYITYEKNISNSDTAVFSAAQTVVGKAGRILAVDGKAIVCPAYKFSQWVRVTPGTHTFRIQYAEEKPMASYGDISYRWEFDIECDEMQAKHVYIPLITTRGNKLSANIKDMGVDPHYGIPYGWFSNKHHFVTF